MDRRFFSGEILEFCSEHFDTSSRSVSIGRLAEQGENILGIVVGSPQMRKVIETIRRFAPFPEGVLIHGESGTGKELVARALHSLGPTPDGPFVTFNCSNLVPSLAESQLFGHVRGAFTDARDESLGYFRAASGGTLFLDEVGELPLELQPKLLRAVENHEVQPVGSTCNYPVQIRIIAATNRDLRAMMKERRFRDDLYYRLNTAALTIPPLRERSGDVAALLGYFVARYNRLLGTGVEFISRDALHLLRTYQWPGNVREFSNSIRSAMMLSDSSLLGVEALLESLPNDARESVAGEIAAAAAKTVTIGTMKTLNEIIDEASRCALQHALRATNGNCQRAADILGVSRITVYRMVSRYGLNSLRSRLVATTSDGTEC